MKSTLIIPTLNEVESIEKVLVQIPKEEVDQILVVDGHSSDGTVELVRKLGYSLIFQEKKGFGSAINTGIREAQGEIIVILNGDGSQNPQDIPRLLGKIKEGYDLVLASRYLPGAGSEDDTLVHYIGNRLFTYLCNKLYKMEISDSLYFFIAARKKIFEIIKPEGVHFEYCIEMPIKAHKAGLKIAEIPSFERKRMGGKGKVSALSVGPKTLWTLLKQ